MGGIKMSENITEKKIVTGHMWPPIPIRSFDWIAYFDGEEHGARGFGKTKEEAIRKLHEEVKLTEEK